jgi:hypothetical protein
VTDSSAAAAHIAQLYAEFVDAETWTASFEVVLQHPELYHPHLHPYWWAAFEFHGY